MNVKELRKINPDELDKKIVELKKDLIKLNAQVATGTGVKSPGQIRQIKRTIARILTVKKEEAPANAGAIH